MPCACPSPSSRPAASMYQSIGTWYENRYYDLQVIQHPIRARQSGFGDKDRRPLAPALVLRLRVLDSNRREVPFSDIIPHMLVACCDLYKDDGAHADLVLHPAFGGSATNSVSTRPEYGGVYGSNGQRQDELPVPRHAKTITFESYPPSRRNQSWSQADLLYPRHNPAPPASHQEPHVPQILMLPQVPLVSQTVLPSIRTFEALGPPNQDAIRNRPYTQSTPSWSFTDSPPSRYDQLSSTTPWESPHRPPKLQIDTTLPHLSSAFSNQPQTAPASHLQFPRATSQYETVPMSGRSDTYTYSPVWQERQYVNGASGRLGLTPSSSHWSMNGGYRNDSQASGLPSLGSALLREPALKKYSRTLIGPVVANGVQLHDDKKREGIYFIFSDLSIRVEGIFRLRVRLVPIILPTTLISTHGRSRSGENAKMLAQAWSEPFEVFSAKRFPGVPEITALSQALSAQGQKLPTRRKTEDHDDGRYEDSTWPDDFHTPA